MGIAADLVSFDETYRGIVESVLGRIAVVTDLDEGIRMAKQHSYKFRIVTLDGQLINPSGAMTGGSLNKNTGMLSRANEITRLAEEQKKLASVMEETAAALKTAKQELDNVTYESQVAQDELRRAQDALLEATSYQKQHAALLDTLRARVEELEEERDSQDARIAQINSKKKDLQAQAEAVFCKM